VAKKYLLGIDLGTSATKASIYRTDGTLIASDSVNVPIYTPQPGVVEQENDDFYNTAAQVVKNCITYSGIEPKEMAAIAFDSQMAGIGSIDEDFKPATRFDSWLDMRCEPYIKWIDKKAGDLVTQLTGCPPTCDHGPKILWWKNERLDDYKRIARFVVPAGYVAGRMAGLKADQAFMDYTFIHFSGLSDAKNCQWSDELCNLFGVDKQKLPSIVKPWDVIGEVTEKAAHDFGLVAGIPIAAGCGDSAANALGAGVIRPGMLFDVAGTASILASCTDEFIADIQHRVLINMRSVIPGLWNPLAYIGGGGLALRWFRDQFFNSHQGKPLEITDDLYDLMAKEAANVKPGADGLFFSPHLGGRICPANPAMRGAWIGFSWGHTQAHFYRAILESVAFEYAYYLNILREYIPGLVLYETRAVGGGSRSSLWNQIKADVLQVPHQCLKGLEFGTWGSAMIAGYAVGIFKDLTETAMCNAEPNGKPFQPDPNLQSVYQPLVKKYIRLQESLDQIFKLYEVYL
jgi:xylulokinase